MTRSFLTRMLGAAAALMMALSVFAGCRVYTGWRTVRLSGDVQETTVYGSGASDGWTVEIEKLSFSDSENAVIRLVPSDSVRIEAKYSGDFADYALKSRQKTGKSASGRIIIIIISRMSLKSRCMLILIMWSFPADAVSKSTPRVRKSFGSIFRAPVTALWRMRRQSGLKSSFRVPQISIFPARRRPLWWTFPVRRMWRRNRLSRRTRTFGCPARARLSCPSRIR